MISLSSDHKTIWEELNDERDRAIYWLEKQFCGAKGIDRERDRLLALSQRTRKDSCSKIVKWKSQRGNLWVAYEYCRYFPETNTSFTMPHAFCYYETIGSVGAFLPMFPTGATVTRPIGCMVFTSHFFLRAAERLGFVYSSEECLARFVTLAPMLSLNLNQPDEKGVISADVRMPGAVGRGKVVSQNPFIVEIRTCLKDTQLSSAQKRQVKNLYEYADLKQQPIVDVAIAQSLLDREGAQKVYEDSRKAFEKAYGDTDLYDWLSWARYLVCTYVDKRNLFKDVDFNFLKQSVIAMERLDTQFVPKLLSKPPMATILSVFSDYARQYMKSMGVKGFDEKDYYDYMVEQFNEAYRLEQEKKQV